MQLKVLVVPEKQDWKFKRKGWKKSYFAHFLLGNEMDLVHHLDTLFQTECIVFDKHM